MTIDAAAHATGRSGRTPRTAMRWIARALLAIWTAFWLWFNVASMIGETDGQIHHLRMALITLGVAIAAWRWPRAGGAVLMLAGVLAALAFPNVAAISLLALPAVVVGALLMLSR
jgi:hypothetical protein